MVKQLRTLTVPQEDWGSIPSTNTAAHLSVTPVSPSTAHTQYTDNAQAKHPYIQKNKIKNY